MPRPFVSSLCLSSITRYPLIPIITDSTSASLIILAILLSNHLFNPNKITPFYVSQTGYSFLSSHYMG